MNTLKAAIVAGLVFAGFWYFSSTFLEAGVGWGPFQVQPFAHLAQPVLILGGIAAVVLFFMLSSRGGR